MHRFLFGPADDPTFTDRFLRLPIEADRWAIFSARTPSFAAAIDAAQSTSEPNANHQFTALLLWPGYASVPDWVWSVPIPVIALAHDPNLLWHGFKHLLPLADLVLTDSGSADRFRRTGLENVRACNLFGLDRHFLAEIDLPEQERDVDLLFVGNLSPAVQPARLPWLARLAALADNHNVVIASGVFGAEYRALLRRSKLAFNLSIRGECNLRALEAAATGAVLLQEADNREVPDYLTPGSEYAPYTAETFESVVARLLAHPDERHAIGERARERVRWCGFDSLIEAAIGVDGPQWKEVQERADRRAANPPKLSLAGRVWQRTSRVGPSSDPVLARDLIPANDRHSFATLMKSPTDAEPFLAVAATSNRVSAIGRASALCDLNRVSEAMELLRVVLADLEAHPMLTIAEQDSVPYPVQFDHLRVGWERASYDHPDNLEAENAAKIALLKCRAYSLLAARTGELTAYEQAAAACPHVPTARAALGCALARAGRVPEAIPHLRFAVENDPLDHRAAAALEAALTETGDQPGADAVRNARRLLAKAAPRLMPAEAQNPSPGGETPPPSPARGEGFSSPSPLARRFGLF